MNNQARVCKLPCKYNIQNICSVYGDCISHEIFIEELEKIKTDILRNSRAYREKLIIDVSQCEIIINSRIAELKGE